MRSISATAVYNHQNNTSTVLVAYPVPTRALPLGDMLPPTLMFQSYRMNSNTSPVNERISNFSLRRNALFWCYQFLSHLAVETFETHILKTTPRCVIQLTTSHQYSLFYFPIFMSKLIKFRHVNHN